MAPKNHGTPAINHGWEIPEPTVEVYGWENHRTVGFSIPVFDDRIRIHTDLPQNAEKGGHPQFQMVDYFPLYPMIQHAKGNDEQYPESY